MKLISCKIENFGTISNQSFHFNENLTVICQNNGFGKTTLAAFIKAMFYGLEPYRKNSFNDRMHFYPFNHGKFGGSLTFQIKDKVYRIERFFDEKSKEELKVYCNHNLTNEFSNESIGKVVFGVDKNSFEKTIFMNARDFDCLTTSDIKDKLTNSIDKMEMNRNFDSLIEKLENVKKGLQSERKVSGEYTGKIPEKRKLRSDLENTERNYKKIQEKLKDKYDEMKKINQDLLEIQQQLKKEKEREIILNHWETYENYRKECQFYQEKLQEIQKKYPKGIPTEDEIKIIENRLEIINQQQIKYHHLQELMNEDFKQYEILSEKFQKDFPDDAKIKDGKYKLNQISEWTIEIDLLNKKELTENEKRLNNIFANPEIDDEQVNVLLSKVEQYKNLEDQYKSYMNSDDLQKVSKQQKISLKYYVIIGFLFLVFLLVGLGLLFYNIIIGIMGIILGIIGLFSDAFIYLIYYQKVGNSYKKSKGNIKEKELNHTMKAMEDLQKQLESFLIPLGYDEDHLVTVNFYNFKKDFLDFKALQIAQQKHLQDIELLQVKKDQLTKELNDFLNIYIQTNDTLENKMNDLVQEINTFKQLKETKANRIKELNELEKNLLKEQAHLKNDLFKYNLDENKIYNENLLHVREEFEFNQNRYREYKEKAEEFKMNKNLNIKPDAIPKEENDLESKESSLKNLQINLNNEINEDEKYVEQLPEISTKLDIINEELNQLNQKKLILEKTIEFLKEAEMNLLNKYILPIKETFVHYYKPIENVLEENISMNKNFQISFEKNGQLRTEDYFSLGERTIIALCFRLALIDKVYPDFCPFILMDDPFVHLDEKHMKQMAKLLNELSIHRQIVYLCCHESRKID